MLVSLYTNIPNDEGLQAAMQTLERHRNQPDIKPKNLTLVKLLEMVLKMNNFQFNGVNFLQVGGTAMGTKVALAMRSTIWELLSINMSTHTA